MAKPRVKIPLLVFMSEIKNDLSLKKIKFSISFLLKNCNNLVYSNAKPRVKIPLLVFMSEIKNDLSLKKIKFSISFLLKNCNNLVYSNASAFRTGTQLFP